MITGPLIETIGPEIIMIPASNFYCPYPVLWALMLGCMALGIVLGYRRAETWRQLQLRILSLLNG